MSRARILADYVAVGTTAAEFDVLDGLTSTTAELNILDGVTSTAAEINLVDGLTSTAVGINDIQTLTNKTLTSPTLTKGHLKASSTNSYCMFYHFDLATGVTNNSYWPWTSIWIGGGAGPYHLSMFGHASYAWTGLNYVTWRTGFSHNGTNLYQYGLDSNNGAHLAGPHFQLTGSGATQAGQVRFQNVSGVTSQLALSVGIMVVSNLPLEAPA